MPRMTWLFGLVVWFALVVASPLARADQSDPRLPALFDQLRSAGDDETAAPITAQIWAIWLHSDDPRAAALMSAGVDSLSAGNLDKALDIFTHLTTVAPDFAEGWNKRATVLYMLGRPADSIKGIDRVLALEPRHFGALSGLGLCDALLHRDQDALRAFQRALAVDPYAPGIRLNIELLKKRLAGESI